MSDSISSRLSRAAGSASRSVAPPDELIQQLRAMPGEDREQVLESLAEKRPGFVNRLRFLLAQAPPAETPAETVARVKPAAEQSSAPVAWDSLAWMQGAQGLSLLDFLAAPATRTPADPADAAQDADVPALEGGATQSAMSAYLANKVRL